MAIHIIVALVIGSSMGVISHILANNNVLILPRMDGKKIYLGFIVNLLVGATAALLGSLLLTRPTLSDVAVISIMAGLGGERFLTSHGAQIELQKQKTAQELEQRYQELNQKASETNQKSK
ncbi:DUF4257 domain-containing protein [Microbacteriaceae bacterium 4G12]